MAWSPSNYLRHQSPRLRPALDLLSKLCISLNKPENEVLSVLDLGCGPGNITRFLCDAFPKAHVHGLDSSSEMITSAQYIHEASPFKDRISFELQSVEDLLQESEKSGAKFPKYDVVYSNAALHWVKGHDVLFPKLLKLLLNPGGVLAVQLPDTRHQPSHLLMESAALRSGLIEQIANVRIPRVEHDPTSFFKWLSPLCRDIDMWTTEYVQQLPNSGASIQKQHPVLEFTRATGLMPVLEAVGGQNSPAGKRFLEEYEMLLQEAYPTTQINSSNTTYKHGEYITLFPFKRFFMVCRI